MKIVTSPSEMKNLSLTLQRAGSTIGLLPTMGALHEGHMSLLRLAQDHADSSVISIFVNPMQFGPTEDFAKYPRPFEEDCRKAEAAGCDIIFAPSRPEMYPEPYCTYVDVERITGQLCGAMRPGHFRGVATVVLKLFNIVSPQIALFGQKDAQQVVVLRRMIHDLNLSVRLEVGPTLREPDGLAMSSRNAYLTTTERRAAPRIYHALQRAEEFYGKGERNAQAIRGVVSESLSKEDVLRPEYIEIVDTVTLSPVTEIIGPVLIAVACRAAESQTRLIDNIELGGIL